MGGSVCCQSRKEILAQPQDFEAVSHTRPTQNLHIAKMSFLDELTVEINGSKTDAIMWKIGDCLGEGAFAKVYECIDLNTGTLLAAKRFKATSQDPKRLEKDFDSMRKEIKLLNELRHPNIVRYYQTDLDRNTGFIYIIMEYVQGGSLKSLIRKYKQLEESIARNYMKQLLYGLQYLHARQIIHRDLKSANILVGEEGLVKLTDFGSSKKYGSNERHLTKSLRGSPYWMSPEVLSRQGHSFPADIWSLGCLLIEMISGRPPWSNYTNISKEVLALIKTDGLIPDIPMASEAWQDFIFLSLARDPIHRPDVITLLEHPFITGEIENTGTLTAEGTDDPSPFVKRIREINQENKIQIPLLLKRLD